MFRFAVIITILGWLTTGHLSTDLLAQESDPESPEAKAIQIRVLDEAELENRATNRRIADERKWNGYQIMTIEDDSEKSVRIKLLEDLGTIVLIGDPANIAKVRQAISQVRLAADVANDGDVQEARGKRESTGKRDARNRGRRDGPKQGKRRGRSERHDRSNDTGQRLRELERRIDALTKKIDKLMK